MAVEAVMDPILTVLCDHLYLFFSSPCQDRNMSGSNCIRKVCNSSKKHKLAFTSTIICEMTCKQDRADQLYGACVMWKDKIKIKRYLKTPQKHILLIYCIFLTIGLPLSFHHVLGVCIFHYTFYKVKINGGINFSSSLTRIIHYFLFQVICLLFYSNYFEFLGVGYDFFYKF